MFSLHSSALGVLSRLAADSNCHEPVAVFSKRTSVGVASAELRDAFESGDERQLRDTAEREWMHSSPSADVFLDVFMYEREDIGPKDIGSIDGVLFELPLPLREFLAETTLFYEDGFLLRDRDGTMVDMPFGPTDARLR